MNDELAKPPFPSLTQGDLVQLIGLLGRDDLILGLAEILEKRLGFNHFHVFLYREKLAPALLASCPNPPTYQRGLKNYLSYTYVINPAYRAYRMGRASGVYMISDFIQNDPNTLLQSPEVEVHIDESEPIGYRTPGWPKNMAEVIVLLNLPNNTALDFTFLTPLGSPQTPHCKTLLEEVFAVLESLLLKQFELLPSSLDVEQVASGQEERFHEFGIDVLTAREREIAQMILVGHSSKSISLNLDISVPTVKSHRRNIYSKLQISSQAELFSLFLLHLK